MIHKYKKPIYHRAAGFTLIEVLVAMVVMTVGMLGVAVLYVEGLRLNRISMLRTTAVTLTTDMAERIRANQSADYTGAGPGQLIDCVLDSPCTPTELKEDDWWHWLDALDTNLPTGYEATIVESAVGPMRRFDITLRWPEMGNEALASYTLSMQL